MHDTNLAFCRFHNHSFQILRVILSKDVAEVKMRVKLHPCLSTMSCRYVGGVQESAS
jgi:hypothetical protein